MDIRVYDAELNFLGFIEEYTSLLWDRKYFEVGNFQLKMPITDNGLRLIKMGNIISFRNATEAGVIEYIYIDESYKSTTMTVKGRFLSSYMDRRIIKGTYVATDKRIETCMRELLSNAVALPLVELGADNGFEETISFQATYKNVLDYEEKLSQQSNIGFRFRPDFVNKVIYFETYKGIDRSVSQSDRNRVIFSEGYANLNETKYTLNDQAYKNVMYVGGEGEGSERTIVIAGDDTLTGLERREAFVSATDVSSDDLTTAEYEAQLLTRGEEKLAEDAITESFECVTVADGNFTYREHYDLGDIVTVKKPSWGVQIDLRITGIQENYEKGELEVEPTFGTPMPQTIDWSDD